MNNSLLNLLKKINDLPFKQDTLNLGGEIFCVGGSCRDAFLDIEPKDLDLLVTKVEKDDLITILDKYGSLDIVGETFGIIKFKLFGSKEEIDISLPRQEILNEKRGHKAFDVTTNPYLPIEADMLRRDITINAIAIDIHGNIIDPYNGLKDLENKEINFVNKDTFLEDPLRMLRCVMFSSRFNFSIGKETLELIKENTSKISEISSERILIEFEKIVSKGNPQIGFELLIETGLYKEIFDKEPIYISDKFKEVRTLGEFIYLLYQACYLAASESFKKHFNGEVNIYKEIKALEKVSSYGLHSLTTHMKRVIYEGINTYPPVINTRLFNSPHYKQCVGPFRTGKYPKSLKELDINGFDLMNLGFEGIEIKNQQNRILSEIFRDALNNNKEDILKFLKHEQVSEINSQI